MESTESRLVRVETKIDGVEKALEAQAKASKEFKEKIYRKLDWIMPALVLVIAVMILLHPTVAEITGLLKR